MSATKANFRKQGGGPQDILNLLFHLSSDIMQKTTTQLLGYQVQPFKQRGPAVLIEPVAFSFGWAAYGFSSLQAELSDRMLVPSCNHPYIIINYSTGFARHNRSWALARLPRNLGSRHGIDPRQQEMAAGLRQFELLPDGSRTLDDEA